MPNHCTAGKAAKPQDSFRPRILLVGHSHLHCVQLAYQQGATKHADVAVLPLYRDKRAGNEPDFDDYLTVELAKLGPSDYDLVALFVGGNTHNTLGLLKLDPPFDYVHELRPELPLADRTTLVPAGAVRELLESRMQALLVGLERLGRRFLPRAVCVESPPPIGDDDYVRNYLDDHFRQGFAEGRDIVSAPLRYKLWRTSSGIYADRCRALGIPYLRVPESALEGGMYLRPEGYPKNVTHGNAWFGALVLDRLVALALQSELTEAS